MIAGDMSGAPELQNWSRSRLTAATATLPLLLMQNIKGGLHLMQQLGRQNILPLLAKVGNLTGQGVGRGGDRRHESLDQGTSFFGKNRPLLQGALKDLDDARIAG